MEEKFGVLIADIVSSKKIEDRENIQTKLKGTLESVQDRKSGKGLISKPAIIRGDEIELSFEKATQCFRTFREIERELYPTKLWGGIGIGGIDTDIRENVSEMDGPAFHRAREALEKGKGTQERPVLFVRCGDEKLEETLDTLLLLLYSVKNDWTERQQEFAEYYLSKEGKTTQKEIGEHFESDQSTVSRTLSRAHISAIEKGQELILKKLSTVDGR